MNGQRPSASNYLLDGLENNDYLVTGPLTAIAPEALQEYRISTNNFSAQYGRTAGFVANAVTRTGGDNWHGLVYLYGKNEALDANDFRRNAATTGPTEGIAARFRPRRTGGEAVVRFPPLSISCAFEAGRIRSRIRSPPRSSRRRRAAPRENSLPNTRSTLVP